MNDIRKSSYFVIRTYRHQDLDYQREKYKTYTYLYTILTKGA